jgi:NitT/TauT family transport system permease protein
MTTTSSRQPELLPPVSSESGTARRSATQLTWSRLPSSLRRVIVLVAVIAIWELYVKAAHVSPLVFSSPLSVAKSFVDGWANGKIASATAVTLEALAIGMAIGIAVAVILTVFATWTTLGRDVLMLFTSMLNPLPSIAILPLAIIWFGLNEKALVFVVANAVVWPIAINVTTGFRTVNTTLVMVGRNLGLRGWNLIRSVLLPASLPSIIAGVKVGWAFGWRTIIAAELVFGTAGGSGGLGYFINNSQYFLNIPDVFAGLVSIAVIGILVEVGFNVLERRTVIRWGMQSRS